MRLFAPLFFLLFAALPASAHFDINGQYRVIVIDRDANEILLRIPAPLVFADLLAERADVTQPLDAPFIRPEQVGLQWGHRLDTEAIAADPQGFMARVARGYSFGEATPTPEALAIHRVDQLAPFATPDEARASLRQPDTTAPWVGDAMVEIALSFDAIPAKLSIESTLPEIALPPDVYIDNHILDWQGGGVLRHNVTGQLTDPVTVERNVLRSLGHMVWQGVVHIIEGPDHVLFVICLTLGAASLPALLWAVSGFTVGHSVTLIAGFLGLAPHGAWFVPSIEAAIAASIMLAALLVLRGKGKGPGLWLTAALGLLHGFGFSFVLGDVLGRQAPDLVASLLSFNIGVEIGQLVIVGLVWLAVAGLQRLGPRCAAGSRITAASIALGLSAVWLVERIEMVRGVV